MAERLELVTDFGALRAGMLVVIKDCHRCDGGRHRVMLIRLWLQQLLEKPSGERVTGDIWELAEPSTCGCDCVSEDDVTAGTVYHVVDGLEAPAARERVTEDVGRGGQR